MNSEELKTRRPEDSKTRRPDIAFAIIVLCFGIYGGFFIYRTSFVVGGERYFALFDDAMVSMRYAKNLAAGHGLTWNPGGERIEGYTNYLWVILMAAFHLLPVAASKICLLVQLTALALLIVNLFLVRKLAADVSDGSHAVALGAVLLTAFYFPINNWSLQGMEVALLIPVVSCILLLAVRSIREKRVSIWLYLMLGAGTLVRPDFAVVFIAITAFMVYAVPETRIKNVTFGLLFFLVFILGQTLLRYLYFGEVFPNTYYLKLTGYPFVLRICRGAWVFVLFVWHINVLLFLLPFGMLLIRRDKPLFLFAWVFTGLAAYSVYVGGDAWEHWGGSNRYMTVVMPAFFIMFSLALYRLAGFAAVTAPRKAGRCIARYGFISALVFSLLSFNCTYGPRALLKEFVPILQRPPHVLGNKTMVERALILNEITRGDAKVAVFWAGTAPYFTDRYVIDILGKNDKKIAREKARISPDFIGRFSFWPGHTKWDYAYSIGKLKPDILAHVWEKLEEVRPYLDREYQRVIVKKYDFYVRTGSEKIYWKKVKVASKD